MHRTAHQGQSLNGEDGLVSVLRQVRWNEVFPWVSLVRGLGMALTIPLLLLGAAAALLTPCGWQLSQFLFLDADKLAQSPDSPLARNAEYLRRLPGQRVVVAPPWKQSPLRAKSVPENPASTADQPSPATNNTNSPSTPTQPMSAAGLTPVADWIRPSAHRPDAIWWRLVLPVKQVFRQPPSLTELAYYSFGTLWTLAIWALFGGAISRIAVVWLGRGERVRVGQALGHAIKRWRSYFAAPLFPLCGALLVALPIYLIGWLLHAGSGGSLVAGLLWIPVLIGGCVMTLLLLGLAAGWPLMWPTISGEVTGDIFEATSRSYSYTFQRPLHYGFYALVAIVLGWLGSLLVQYFTEGASHLSYWAVASAAGESNIANLRNPTFLVAADSEAPWVARTLFSFGDATLRTARQAFTYSFFWCSISAIYLLLRRNTDQIDFDELFIPDEVDQPVLPPLDDQATPDAIAVAPEEQ